MGTIKVTSNNVYNILINDLTSNNYTSSASDLNVLVEYESPDISGTLANETNFPASGEPTDSIPAKLTIKIKKAEMDPLQYLGFRLSAAAANTDFKFKTTNDEFAATENTIPINSGTDNIIWAASNTASLTAQADGTDAGYILIPVEIRYTGSTAGTELTFTVDVYENTTAVATDSNKLTVASGLANLIVTAYTASLSSSMSSADIGTIKTPKDTFKRNDPISVSTNFTEVVADGYKKISKIQLTENLTTSITATNIYITTSSTFSSISDLNTDASKTKEEGSVTVNLPLNTPITGVLSYSSGTVSLTMENTDSRFEKIFTEKDVDTTTNVLPENVYIYISGTVTGLGTIGA